jgi:hypothetical protein
MCLFSNPAFIICLSKETSSIMKKALILSFVFAAFSFVGVSAQNISKPAEKDKKAQTNDQAKPNEAGPDTDGSLKKADKKAKPESGRQNGEARSQRKGDNGKHKGHDKDHKGKAKGKEKAKAKAGKKGDKKGRSKQSDDADKDSKTPAPETQKSPKTQKQQGGTN